MPELEYDTVLPEPEAPKQPKVKKKANDPKVTGVVFKEIVPQEKKSTLAPPRDKGKGILDEPFPMAKWQKMTTIPEQRQVSSVPEVLDRQEVDTNHHLSLHGVAVFSWRAIAAEAMARVAHSLNILGGDLWGRLQDDNVNNLLELSVHTGVVVCILYT